MPTRPIASLIIVAIFLTVVFEGCAVSSSPVGSTARCRQAILGATGAIRRETSGLKCRAINRLISGIPSEPQAYLIQGEMPSLQWKCKFYGTDGQLMLRCEHHKRHFSIVKAE